MLIKRENGALGSVEKGFLLTPMAPLMKIGEYEKNQA
jgi:hypothetical protein